MQTCKEWFTEGLKTYGYSAVESEIKAWKRRRVPEGRPKQDQFKWGEYVRLYRQERGVCPLCGEDMPLIKGKIEMDHINSQLTGEAYNARQNRQVVCKPCNAEKNATTVPGMAKRTGRTMTDIVKPGYMAEDAQEDDTPIVDGGMAESCL